MGEETEKSLESRGAGTFAIAPNPARWSRRTKFVRVADGWVPAGDNPLRQHWTSAAFAMLVPRVLRTATEIAQGLGPDADR